VSWRAELPDGRSVAVAAEARDRLCAGIIVVDPVRCDDGSGPAEAASRLGAELAAKYEGLPPSRIPGLAEARNLYKSFGMEPTRHRPSSEALLRRMIKGQGLYRISNLVDACNLASLSFLLPIGMYDLGRIRGDVVLRTGNPGEEYPGIRKGPVNLEGRLGLFDDEGPFGSPTSDSARTCTGRETEEILAVIMATADYPRTDMAANLHAFAGIYAEHCEGTTAFQTVFGGQA